MKQQFQLAPVNLSDSSALQTLVEHRRVFNLKDCELNIYETYHNTNNVILSYNGMVISSMLRGKKTMSLEKSAVFDFLPGESVILPEGVSMDVGFPDVDEAHPAQCATLALNNEMVKRNLTFLNEHYSNNNYPFEWKLNFQQYHFLNNKELASSINRLISISMEDSLEKDALADMSLKFLLMRVIQTQNLAMIDQYKISHGNLSPAIRYMHEQFRNSINIEHLSKICGMSKTIFYSRFKEQFGITPLDYLLRCRIDHAKKMMLDVALNISDICYLSGFNNVNYFIRIFKRLEGLTPKAFRATMS